MHLVFTYLILFSSLTHANPKVIEITNEYIVIAKKPSSLSQVLNDASPVKEDGKIFHAHTDTYVDWKYWWTKRSDYCKLNRVETTVQITYILPKLDISTRNTKVKKIWKKYLPAVVKHEKGHANIAINAAKEIEVELIKMEAYRNCDELSKKANQKAKAILNKYKPQHKTYDIKTDHGKTQGADLGFYM